MKILFIIILFIIAALVFRSYYNFIPLSAGDWGYLGSVSLMKLPMFPYVWSHSGNDGLGGNVSFILPLEFFYFSSSAFLSQYVGLNWVFIERIVWFIPFVILSFVSSYFLFRMIISRHYAFLSAVIYVLNTYILMVVGGGQMGVALAYSVVPFVFLAFVKYFQSGRYNYFFLYILSLGLLVTFDLRITYIVLFGLLIFGLVNLRNTHTLFVLKSFILNFLLPGIMVFMLHLYWIIPFLFSKSNPIDSLNSVYFSLDAVDYFSFSKLENSFALLHPNWPENIFGKTYFLSPEFLILPLLAFSSLLFLGTEGKEKRKVILGFVLIALFGIFLAKGTQEPFGEIYRWLFSYMPGFYMFRDSSKWYVLIALAYSILIPYTIASIIEYLVRIRGKINADWLKRGILLLFLVFWFATIKEAVGGSLSGTFQNSRVPEEYERLEKFLDSDARFSRVLWIPSTQRFGAVNLGHPAVSGLAYFNQSSLSSQLKELNKIDTITKLQRNGVGYLVIPYDSKREIFIEKGKFDANLYDLAIRTMNENPYLIREKVVDDIGLYKVPGSKDLIWIDGFGNVYYRKVNPTKYTIDIDNAISGQTIIMTEYFDDGWVMRVGEEVVNSYNFENMNGFILPRGGSYSATLEFLPQRYVLWGILLSSGVFVVLVAIFIVRFRKSKRKA